MEEWEEAEVERLLGRRPQGGYRIVARDADGKPVVIENEPFLADGTPMPTLFWLVGERAREAVGRLEAVGGVDESEAEIGPEPIAAAHRRYAALRDSKVPENYLGPRPSGGVGGTARGVKCLHAHYAWYLAAGADPVGEWVHDRLVVAGEDVGSWEGGPVHGRTP